MLMDHRKEEGRPLAEDLLRIAHRDEKKVKD